MKIDILTNQSYAECYYENRSNIDEQATSIIDLITNNIGILNSITVLDVGSGPGRLALPIGQQAKKIVCVEPDISAANYLKSRFEKCKVNFEIHISRIQDLSSQKIGKFDLVILSHIIHWFEASSPFGCSTKFVKENGYMLLSFFNPDRLSDMLFYKVSGSEILTRQLQDTPSITDIEYYLSSAGFEIIKQVDIKLNVFYGDGKLERIINNAGTLAWQKLKNTLPEEKYTQIKQDAFFRLKNESSLNDIEHRSMILAKKVTSL